MTATLIIALCLVFVLLPWAVLMTLIVNQLIADFREWKRGGRGMEPADRDFLRLCYVVLMLALWLKGW